MYVNVYYIMTSRPTGLKYLRRCANVANQPFAFYGEGEVWATVDQEHAIYSARQYGGVVDSIPVFIPKETLLLDNTVRLCWY